MYDQQGNLGPSQLKVKEEALKRAEEIVESNRKYMRDLIGEGKLPQLQSLTRKQRKDMDAAGVNITKIKADDKRTYAEITDCMIDWIFDHVYPDFKGFDDLDEGVCKAFGLLTFSHTYRDNLAEKNL